MTVLARAAARLSATRVHLALAMGMCLTIPGADARAAEPARPAEIAAGGGGAGEAARSVTIAAAAGGAGPAVLSVEIQAADGFGIKGRYLPGGAGAPGILMLHQCDREGAPTGYETLADLLWRRGFHVLVPDLRGYGESRNEKFTGVNWEEAQSFFPRDTETVYQFLIARPGVAAGRIGVVGASCGGRQAILLAAGHPGIRALAILSVRGGAAFEESLKAVSDRPVFAISAEGDRTAAETASRSFELSTHRHSRMVVYKGAAHGTPLLEEDPSLGQAIAGWLESSLQQ